MGASNQVLAVQLVIFMIVAYMMFDVLKENMTDLDPNYKNNHTQIYTSGAGMRVLATAFSGTNQGSQTVVHNALFDKN